LDLSQWLPESLTILALSRHWRDLRLPAFLNGFGMAIALIISGVWSAPAHGKLADGFDADIRNQLMNANLVRTLAWTLCGVGAVWLVARQWSTDVRKEKSSTQS